MAIKNQSSYLTLLLMLATLNIEISPAEATLSPEKQTIPERIARVQEVLRQKSVALEEENSSIPLNENINKEDISLWADWGDLGRRGGGGGWVDAWAPGWGDWGDTSRWGDWGDIW